MYRVIGVFVATYSLLSIQCTPINNGFSVKFNPLNAKEEVKKKMFGALFAKIPQEWTSEADVRREVISKAYYPNAPDLGNGCSNQVAKIVQPLKMAGGEESNEPTSETLNFINLPVLKQPFENYKVLMATAPPNIKLSGEGETKHLVIYIVFPEDGADEQPIIIPTIYFVGQVNGKMDISKKEKVEPLFIIDSNRTVTGLKSKEIEKYVRFKNKLTNRYKYQLS